MARTGQNVANVCVSERQRQDCYIWNHIVTHVLFLYSGPRLVLLLLLCRQRPFASGRSLTALRIWPNLVTDRLSGGGLNCVPI